MTPNRKPRIPNGIRVIRLEDKWDTEIRRLNYKGAVIDLVTSRSLGYRTLSKSCEIRFPDGTRLRPNVENFDPYSMSRYKSNARIFQEAKEEVREWHTQQAAKVRPA